jgi:hypothetical protein
MRPFERVHMLTDYYDGPRQGIADFNGAPHLYESFWDESQEEFSEVHELRPVDAETFRLALEDWDIWMRWEDAFYAGQTTIDTHPALPPDRERHLEIAAVLPSRFDAFPDPP